MAEPPNTLPKSAPSIPLDKDVIEKAAEKERKAAEKEERRKAFEAQKALMVPSAEGEGQHRMTKDERREKQERERAEKEAKKSGVPDGTKKDAPRTRSPPKTSAPVVSSGVGSGGKASPGGGGEQTGKKAISKPSGAFAAGVHPAVFQCGLWTKNFYVVGSNARCIAMLLALKDWMRSVAAQKSMAVFVHESFAGTKKALSTQLSFMASCRARSVGMSNAIRLLKQESFRISNLSSPRAEHDAYDDLCSFVDTFILEKIEYARDKMIRHATPLIQSGDVILTYAHSSVIRELLYAAGRNGTKSFHVIVVDSPPLNEGRALLAALSTFPTVQITYCQMTSLGSTLPKANKVFLGASATMSNGEILSRSGTALVALMAKQYHIPVIGFCETYKFTNQVWLGNLTNNEERTQDGVLQYMYDLTPVSLIDVIITEYGPTPPMNIGTVIRDKTEVLS